MSDIPLPTVVEIEPTAVCNIRCRMCHVSFMREMRRPLLDPALIHKLAPLRDAHFIIASGFEPAMHPNLPEILTTLAGMGAAFEIVTNGTIVTDNLLAALAAGNVRHITFSFDGITQETYEHIRRGADYDQGVAAISAASATPSATGRRCSQSTPRSCAATSKKFRPASVTGTGSASISSGSSAW